MPKGIFFISPVEWTAILLLKECFARIRNENGGGFAMNIHGAMPA